MAERILISVAMFLVLGPLIILCVPNGPLRDKVSVFWGRLFLGVLYFGGIAGGLMFVVLLLDKLFRN